MSVERSESGEPQISPIRRRGGPLHTVYQIQQSDSRLSPEPLDADTSNGREIASKKICYARQQSYVAIGIQRRANRNEETYRLESDQL